MPNSSPGCLARLKWYFIVKCQGGSPLSQGFPLLLSATQMTLASFYSHPCGAPKGIRGFRRSAKNELRSFRRRGLDECEAFVFPSDPTSAAALDQLFNFALRAKLLKTLSEYRRLFLLFIIKNIVRLGKYF